MLGRISDPRDAAHSTVVTNLLLKVSRRSLTSASGTSTVMRDLLSDAAPVTVREKSATRIAPFGTPTCTNWHFWVGR